MGALNDVPTTEGTASPVTPRTGVATPVGIPVGDAAGAGAGRADAAGASTDVFVHSSHVASNALATPAIPSAVSTIGRPMRACVSGGAAVRPLATSARSSSVMAVC